MKVGRIIVLSLVLVLFGTWAYADECNSVRYVNNADGTVTDCRTGLIWLQNAHCMPYLSWHDAMAWVKGLAPQECDLYDNSREGDWRLPTKVELMAMVTQANRYGFTYPSLTNDAGTAKWTEGNVFISVQSYGNWTSTTKANDAINAWVVDTGDGTPYYGSKAGLFNVWPVRGGQAESVGSLIIE